MDKHGDLSVAIYDSEYMRYSCEPIVEVEDSQEKEFVSFIENNDKPNGCFLVISDNI